METITYEKVQFLAKNFNHVFFGMYIPINYKLFALHLDLLQQEIITPIGCFEEGLMQCKCNSFGIPLLAYPLAITIKYGNLCFNTRNNINPLFLCLVNVHCNSVYMF